MEKFITMNSWIKTQRLPEINNPMMCLKILENEKSKLQEQQMTRNNNKIEGRCVESTEKPQPN